MPTPHLNALAFDAYGTLFDVFSVTAACERACPGRGVALAQGWRAKQLQYSLLRSLMGRYADFRQITEDGLVYAAASLGLELSGRDRQVLMDTYRSLEVFADVRPGLAALKQRGVRLAILSNGAPGMLAEIVEQAGLGNLIDDVVSADEVRIFKPSPQVYRLLPDRLGLDLAQTGFVSSNSWDICGAASAGLATFWIRRTAAEPPEVLGWTAQHTVSALTDLPALL